MIERDKLEHTVTRGENSRETRDLKEYTTITKYTFCLQKVARFRFWS